ncbi:hypothetical protein OEZ85_002403 [Tetradesmus obliquus]|uniref:Vacuolar protein-sorting-associated protein 25 n=1 Tax=Tetradesmus obliquus TaxID=3088 RepID=A0ABY8U2V4_TETOB|nr:hypothetical protein OEZ85_002403 [Tetradesmus obliquus]
MGSSSTFSWPYFYQYPPYFTRQPVKETADRQSSLWGSLILAYCKHHKLYVLSPSEDIPLWVNKDINRRLAPEAAVSFLDDLVAAGSALWLDGGAKLLNALSLSTLCMWESCRAAGSALWLDGGAKPLKASSALWLDGGAKARCLVLWRRLPDVAAAIASWAASYGMADSVMLLDELAAGPEVAGTELEGLHREVLLRALQLLEAQGKVKLFKGATPEEEGVKFL